MSRAAPHYLLLSETQTNRLAPAGSWRFVLERMDGSGRIEVADEEPEVWGERLQLLAVVRGLEALEQPSRVTLITPSRYVGRGIRSNLAVWRENQWQWERFGEMTPVKHADLWQRVDRAMDFHTVDCRIWDLGHLMREEFLVDRMSPAVRSPSGVGLHPTQFSQSRDRRTGTPSWRDIGVAIANRVNPFRVDQVYGCA